MSKGIAAPLPPSSIVDIKKIMLFMQSFVYIFYIYSTGSTSINMAARGKSWESAFNQLSLQSLAIHGCIKSRYGSIHCWHLWGVGSLFFNENFATWSPETHERLSSRKLAGRLNGWLMLLDTGKAKLPVIVGGLCQCRFFGRGKKTVIPPPSISTSLSCLQSSFSFPPLRRFRGKAEKRESKGGDQRTKANTWS